MEKPDWWTSDEWATPDDVFGRIAAKYGPFDLDACCRPDTAKVPHFYTKHDDGLSQPWNGRVWVNPPYSQPRVWVERAIRAVNHEGCRVVMLLPGAVDTKWFHDLVLPNADVVFLRGRVRFIGWEGTPIGSPKSGNVLALFPKLEKAMSVDAVDPHAPLRESRPRATETLPAASRGGGDTRP